MNYEALGRYTEASERAHSFAAQRHNKLSDLARAISAATGMSSSGFVAVELDFARVQGLVDEAAKLDASLMEAVAEANANASHCGKAPLKLWTAQGR